MKKEIMKYLIGISIIGFAMFSDAAFADCTVSDSTAWYVCNNSAGPFEIREAAELAYLATLVNSSTDDFDKKTIKLVNDIDLSDRNWTPIGTTNKIFFPVHLMGVVMW